MADGTTFPPYNTIPGLPAATSLNTTDQVWINQAGVDVRANIGDIVSGLAPATVTTFNSRTGAVILNAADIVSAEGALINSPQFQGVPLAPTAATGTASGQIATTQFVANAIGAATPGVTSFNTRTGDISLTLADIVGAGGVGRASPAFTGTPVAPTPPPGNNGNALATTAFVVNALSVQAPGVNSFNNRNGAVSLILSDVTGVGGAPLSSPVLVGVPQAPTAAPGSSTTQIATTAFVQAAVTAGVAGVGSFNGRTGAVTLTTADLTGAGGATAAQLSIYAPINAPQFTGVPSAPTASLGTATTQLATTQFVSQALAGVTGVTSFNTRQGVVTLTAGDVTGVGGALLASPVFTGAPQAPTPPAADSSTALATTAWVMSKIAGVPQGTVTSVGLALPNIFSVSGSPVTGSGVLTGALVNQNAGAVFAGPATGSPATPGFRPLQQSDISAIAVTAFNGRTGSVTLTAGDVAAVGVSSFNTRIGAVTLSQADVSAVAVGSFNGRTGAVTLTAADVSGAGGPYATTAAVAAGYLPLTGGTLTGGLDLTGVYASGPSTGYALAIDAPTGQGAFIKLNAPVGQADGISGLKAGNLRWSIQPGDGSIESGSNAGSNFIINSYADTGTQIGTPLTISRATGQATFSGNVGINNQTLTIGPAAWTSLIFAKQIGSGCQILGGNGTGLRWNIIPGDNAAESGSNAGSNFLIQGYNDSGTSLGNYLTINRATGITSLTTLNVTNIWPASGDANHANFGIVVDAPSGHGSYIALNSPGVGGNGVFSSANGNRRWSILLGDGSAETGSNSGNNFIIQNYADNATQLGNALVIARSNGLATFSGPVVSNTFPTQGASYLVTGYYIGGSWFNGERLSVNVSGSSASIVYGSGVNTATWSVTGSDRRKKSNIRETKPGNAIDTIAKIKVYDLDFDPGIISHMDDMPSAPVEHWPFSMIADEVAKVLPHAAIRVREDDGLHWVGLHPTHLISVLWKAVQELSDGMQQLTAEVAALKAGRAS